MPIIIPTQERTFDPFTEYRFSSTINRLSRVITGGKDCVLFPTKSFNVSKIDWKTISINKGIAFKDDTMIHMKEIYNIDMTNSEYYIDTIPSMDSQKYYYLVLHYVYKRKLPSGYAEYKLIKNSNYYNSESFMYLWSVPVVYNESTVRYELAGSRITQTFNLTVLGNGGVGNRGAVDDGYNYIKLSWIPLIFKASNLSSLISNMTELAKWNVTSWSIYNITTNNFNITTDDELRIKVTNPTTLNIIDSFSVLNYDPNNTSVYKADAISIQGIIDSGDID